MASHVFAKDCGQATFIDQGEDQVFVLRVDSLKVDGFKIGRAFYEDFDPLLLHLLLGLADSDQPLLWRCSACLQLTQVHIGFQLESVAKRLDILSEEDCLVLFEVCFFVELELTRLLLVVVQAVRLSFRLLLTQSA